MSSVPARLIPVTMIITVGNLSFPHQWVCGFIYLQRAFTASRVISQDLRSFHIKMVVRWRQSSCSFQWKMFFQILLQKTGALLGAYQICVCVCVCVCVQACVYCRLTKEHLQSLLFSIFSFSPLLPRQKSLIERDVYGLRGRHTETHTHTHTRPQRRFLLGIIANNYWACTQEQVAALS